MNSRLVFLFWFVAINAGTFRQSNVVTITPQPVHSVLKAMALYGVTVSVFGGTTNVGIRRYVEEMIQLPVVLNVLQERMDASTKTRHLIQIVVHGTLPLDFVVMPFQIMFAQPVSI